MRERTLSSGGSPERVGSISVPQSPDVGKVEKGEGAEKAPDAPLGRIMRVNAPEWPYIVLGCLAALLNGAIQPSFAVVFSKMLSIFGLPLDDQETKASFYALMFLVIGFASLVAMFFQNFMFALSGEKLTKRLRGLAFKAMLRQEIAWFDDSKNSTGVLTTRLATDASAVKGVR